MAIDLQQTFSSGGKPLVELLSHCVFSINMDAVFLYLVREYQFHPHATCAVALYDVFCNPHSPGKISVASRHVNGHLDEMIENMRRIILAIEASRHPVDQPESADQIELGDADHLEGEKGDKQPKPNESEENGPPVLPLPPRFLFDSIAAGLTAGMSDRISGLESYYDPSLSARENLPGGKLDSVQLAFLNNTWVPQLRPYLVSAGFWRIATIG